MSTSHFVERLSGPDVGSDPTTVALTCPSCESRLQVIETHSGGRSVSVVWFGALTESCPDGVERFEFAANRDIVCPACNFSVDSSATYRRFASTTPRFRRRVRSGGVSLSA
jgi:DNA-directed RNA polymerase subunit RPC12/RpoP